MRRGTLRGQGGKPRGLRFPRLLSQLRGKTPSPSHASVQTRRPPAWGGGARTSGRPGVTSGTLTPAPRCSRGRRVQDLEGRGFRGGGSSRQPKQQGFRVGRRPRGAGRAGQAVGDFEGAGDGCWGRGRGQLGVLEPQWGIKGRA